VDSTNLFLGGYTFIVRTFGFKQILHSKIYQTMRKIFLTAIVAVAIFASCNSSNTNTKPLVVASDTATVKYQCPMKCEGDTCYTTAGQCTVCEMDLEKK